MTSGRLSDANDNLQTTFVSLAEHSELGATRKFNSITAACVGVPIPFFNRVFVFEPPAPDDISAAAEWMAGQEVPFWVTVPDHLVEAVETVASDLGPELSLVKSGASEPGMVLSSLDEMRSPETDLSIEVVSDSAKLNTFVTVSSDAFEIPPEIGRHLAPSSMLEDDGMQLFLGHAEGQPVACGLLAQTDDVAGVYTIGVVEAFRRRGFGEAMTWAVLRAGRDRGCTVGSLQSSELGFSVYEKMGFETIVEYHHFTLAS